MKRANLNRRSIRVATTLAVAAGLAVGLAPARAEQRSVLGIQIQELTADLAKGLGVAPSTSGVVVSQVREDSPAAKAGVKAGDIIVEYDGQAVGRPRELSERVAATPVGKSVTLKVLRSGQLTTLSATTAGMEMTGQPPEGPRAGRFGLALMPLTPELAQHLGVAGQQGLVVHAVRKGSPADQAGLRPGDVITEVNRQPLTNVEQLRTALEQAAPDKPAVLLVLRGGRARYVTVKG